jgi:hypothetical protein
MRKHISLVMGILLVASAYSQRVKTWTENFDDGNVTFIGNPSSLWEKDTTYYASPPNAYLGLVPNMTGAISILETPTYDLSAFHYVLLQFKHICKISPFDVVRFEYRISNGGWKPVPASAYLGDATNYLSTGFNAASYSEWQTNDSLAMPDPSWWKEEHFDVSFEVGTDNSAQFRFVIQHGNVQGTQISYGWLLDDFEITASVFQIKEPAVAFLAPVIADTVYSTGPYKIRVRVKTQTNVSIETPVLKYTATNNGVTLASDSILMTATVSGDSLWTATIPQFTLGTTVTYSITGKDTNENQASASLTYIIAGSSGVPEEVIVGTGITVSAYTPFSTASRYSWSRQLYFASELSPTSSGGWITHLAWDYDRSSTSYYSQKCYLLAVDDTIAYNRAFYPLAEGATEVWSGTITLNQGWCEIEFTTPFYLPYGKNLLVYWESRGGGSSYNYFRVHGARAYQTIVESDPNAFPERQGFYQTNRANARFTISSIPIVNNHSALLQAIDIPNLVIVAPSKQVPIAVSFQNKGFSDLDSIIISYTINGSTPANKTWHGKLTTDMSITDTVDYYTPKLNGLDTIVAWISMPNGFADGTTYEDTVTKIIYGSSDIAMSFVYVSDDTVSEVGPFPIEVRISSLTNNLPNAVKLHVSTTLSGNTKIDSFAMNADATGNLWKSQIPTALFGSNIVYWVSLTDVMGNNMTISDSFYIKRILTTDIVGYYIFAAEDTLGQHYGMALTSNAIYATQCSTSWNRHLYMSYEISTDYRAMRIARIAWYNTGTLQNQTRTDFTIHLKTTSESEQRSQNYVEPLSDGATLVYSGSITTKRGWNEVTLTTPYIVPQGSNLMVYFEDKTNKIPSPTGEVKWAVSDCYALNRISYYCSGANGNLGDNIAPVLRFTFTGMSLPDNNSVALVKILPETQDLIPGVTTNIKAVIRNRGINNLTSCVINWELNGGTMQTYTWTGKNMPEDFYDTITLYTYTPAFGDYDVVQAWVSMPNGVTDMTTDDDMLTAELRVCGNGLKGTYGVGSSSTATYGTLYDAITAIQTCGIDEKVILSLDSGTHNLPTYVDMEMVSNMRLTDTLIITSATGKASDVILKTAAGNGLRLYKNNNIVIQAITIDAVAGKCAIEFIGSCTNIVIRDCYLLADTVNPTSASGKMVIFKEMMGSVPILQNISIINNRIEGGYRGIYLPFSYVAGSGSFYNEQIIIDSNMFINNYYQAVMCEGTDVLCRYNTILSPLTNADGWYGMRVSLGPKARILNNHVQQRCAGTSPYGISTYDITALANIPDTGIIANNEIILFASTAGIGIEFAKAKILNNSIYISGTGNARGISTGTGIGEIKNNNIVTFGIGAAPYYANAATSFAAVDVDYNNIYNTSDMICNSSNATYTFTLKAWKETMLKDLHSVRMLPNFMDPTTSLELASYKNMMCSVIEPIQEDINGTPRMGITLLGSYGFDNLSGNGTLAKIEGLQEGFAVGQTDSVHVVLYNTGTTALTAVSLGWSINGVMQNGSIPFSVSLNQGESVTLGVGTITYPAGTVTVEVWINSLNGGTLTDGVLSDDTVTKSIYLCQDALKGMLTIGTTGDFPSLTAAYDALQLCGVGGNVTLAFQTGNYFDNLDLTNSNTLLGNYTLTITSVTGHAADVTLSSGGVAFRMNNTNNIIIKDITIDVTKGTYGIQFTGTTASITSNITVDNCIIRANSTTIDIAGGAGIYKATSTGILNDLSIANCTIEGGYAGIYIVGTAAIKCQNIVIENNMMTNQYYYSTYIYYTREASVSENRITPGVNTGTTWYGLYVYYTRINVVGNHISSDNYAQITGTLSGIYLGYDTSMLVANNEVYFNGATVAMNGIYITYSTATSVIHNTVYLYKSGTSGTSRAYHNQISTASHSSEIKNNIFVVSGGAVGTTYAIYLDITAANYTLYGANFDLDYNSYYTTGTNLGYVAGANRTDLNAWKTFFNPIDEHSVNVLPIFSDPANGLQLSLYPDTLLCPRWGNVLTDISHIERPEVTAMGAYTHFTNGQDLFLRRFAEWNSGVVEKQTIPLNIVLYNNGVVPITSAQIGWKLNTAATQFFNWTASPALAPLEERVVNIGSFPVSNTVINYDVIVWVNAVNNQSDTVKWNDTIQASASLNLLGEFVAPFIPDTIVDLSFAVNAFINPLSGATVNPPTMTMISTIYGTTTVYDTIPMVFDNNIWQAIVPPKYYGTKIIYSIALSDTVGNYITLTDSTYIRSALSILGNPALTSVMSLTEPLNTTGCMPDYTPIKVELTNLSTVDYDFSRDTVFFVMEIIDADTVKHEISFPFTGALQSGSNILELAPSFPTVHPGAYHIKIWLSSPTDHTPYKDTLYYTYISGKVGLPLDEDFGSGIPLAFDVWGNNSPASWTVLSQGTGADTVVMPQFGSGMLSFGGSRGAMSTLAVRQMDLSRTVDPLLTFWYFHDTVPCKDYTDVRITVDGGMTYNTLLSLTKYDAVYGWKQYDVNLPPYAINQCVILIFEAMERSVSGDVSQYIDRIRITAKQDIAVIDVLTSPLSACSLQHKELKMVVENLSDPALNYAAVPTIFTIEVKETGQIYQDTLTSSSLGGYATDTITVATDIDFTKGTYTFKAYFSTVFDIDGSNDTLETTLVINPTLSVRVKNASGGNNNCIAGEYPVWQEVTLTNAGNMDLSNIGLILQIDTGETGSPAYVVIKETYANTISVGDSATYIFQTPYTTTWHANYYAIVNAYLLCDSSLVNAKHEVMECVNMKDLYIASIDNLPTVKDSIGNTIPVAATLVNRSDYDDFRNVEITVSVTNSQGNQTETFTEIIPIVDHLLASTSYTFTQTYTVPNDTVYYLTVYTNSYDLYLYNDTVTERREAVEKPTTPAVKGIDGMDGFALGQNVPNPATNSTQIDYNIPESGEVIFSIQSASGQVLYSKTIEAVSGKNSLEVNTSTLAAGIYIYSMEYKGRRIVKRMSIN